MFVCVWVGDKASKLQAKETERLLLQFVGVSLHISDVRFDVHDNSANVKLTDYIQSVPPDKHHTANQTVGEG